MNFKKQAIVAAAILAVAGAANANLTSIASNSTLAFVAVDTVAKTSTLVDLGATFQQFLPQGTTAAQYLPGAMDGTMASGFDQTASALTYTPGTTLSWDFSSNTFKVNGAAQATIGGKAIDWSPFNTFKNGTSLASTKWGVIGGAVGTYNLDPALDTYGLGAQTAFEIATTGPAAVTVDSTTVGTAGGKVNTLFVTNSTLGTNAAANTAGASVVNVGKNGYLGNDNEFGLAGAWGNSLAFSALAGVNTSQNFYWTTDISADVNGGPASTVVKYDGQFAFNGTTLTYTVPGSVTPSVPEPEGFALALVGLAAIGFVARRRQA